MTYKMMVNLGPMVGVPLFSLSDPVRISACRINVSRAEEIALGLGVAADSLRAQPVVKRLVDLKVGAAPEMMIHRCRWVTWQWQVL